MASITNIASSDLISNSREDINNNFTNLNNDKIETSVLDTDTSLTANSDTKIATQKAVKAYADAVSSPTGKSWNEYAVDAVGTDSYAITLTGFTAYVAGQTFKFKAGTANTGACSLNVNGLGAKTIKKDVSSDLATGDILANQIVTVIYDGTNMQLVSEVSGLAKTADLPAQTHTIGALTNSLVKTYFNIQLPFTLWTGAVVNDTTTTFANWVRSDGTDVEIPPLGIMSNFISTGSAYIYSKCFNTPSDRLLKWNDTNIVIFDWWAKLPDSGTGDITMGFTSNTGDFINAYNFASDNAVCFAQKSTGELYATIRKSGTGVTNTDISSGLTLTNWNNYRIEFDISNEVKFYVNGVLKATLSGANLYSATNDLIFGFGRSNTSLFQVTAPTLSLQMNP